LELLKNPTANVFRYLPFPPLSFLLTVTALFLIGFFRDKILRKVQIRLSWKVQEKKGRQMDK